MTWTPSDQEADSLKRVVATFEAHFPSTKVEVIFTPQSSYFQRYLQLSADGKAPDVIDIDSNDTWRLVENHLLEDLNRYMGESKRITDPMLREYVTSFIYKGVQSAIPLRYAVGALAYNANLFKDAGLPNPSQFSKSKVWTWTSFLSVAKKLTRHKNGDSTQKDDIWGYAENESWFWDYWVYSNGGSLLTVDNTKCALDSGVAVEALQFQADLAFRHKVTPSAGYFINNFGDGLIGMALGTGAMFQTWKTGSPSLKWGLSQFPCPAELKPYVRLSAQGIAISRQSHRKIYAWDFVRYLSGLEGQKQLIQFSPWSVPANLQVSKSEAYLGQKTSQIFETLLSLSQRADAKRNPFNIPLPDTFHQTLTLELAQYWAVRIPSETAISRFVPRLNKLLDDWNRKRARKIR